MMKRFFGAALIITALLTGACQTVSNLVSEPSVSFNSVSITGLGFDGANLLAKVNVQNDNPFSIPLPEIDWNFFVSNNSFLTGTIKSNGKIAANGSSIVEIPFKVPYEGLYNTVSSLQDTDEAPYRIDLGARFPIPVIQNKTFTTSFSGSLPMLKMPSLSFRGISFTSLSLSKVEFVLTWQVENKNAFAVNLDKLDYVFAVNDSTWSSGSAPQNIVLPARKSTQVPVTVNISALSAIQEIVTLAAGRNTADYTCNGEAVLSPKGLAAAAALKLPFNYSGTTALRR
jgi:LEA14-like dessication related protein